MGIVQQAVDSGRHSVGSFSLIVDLCII